VIWADEKTMRTFTLVVAALISLQTALFGAAEPEAIALPRHVLTNDGLVVLARAGLGDGLLVDLIRHKRSFFDTSAEALAQLARHGLSERVLRAVVEKQEEVRLRKPKVSLRPLTPYGTSAPVEVEDGELILLPGGEGRRGKSDPDRWYRISTN